MNADRIIISDLEVFAHHGVLPEEKLKGQLFYLDLELSVDLLLASQSDDLGDTVSYDEVCKAAHDAMTADTYDLIERAAGAVCSAVLDRFPLVREVEVTLKKPYAPLCRKAGCAAVRLTRGRVD